MSYHTCIECTEATWNPVTGCSKVSTGCKHCYAEREWKRLSANPKTVYIRRQFTEVRCHPERLEWPLRWKQPRLIFVNSMSDLFHDDVPDAFIERIFAVMGQCPRHRFMVITKRPLRMREFMRKNKPATQNTERHRNVWLAISAENQETADERIPILLDTPARVRFLTLEPLLGPIDLKPWLGAERHAGIHWVITGGETGTAARPMDPAWARLIRDQCRGAGVAFFFKHHGNCQRLDDGSVRRVPKSASGRLLDGRTWDEYPPQYFQPV
ncbi:MAG: DUF5131 family protein [Burkholderiales bacterium]